MKNTKYTNTNLHVFTNINKTRLVIHEHVSILTNVIGLYKGKILTNKTFPASISLSLQENEYL